jgi:hypothetical protein
VPEPTLCSDEATPIPPPPPPPLLLLSHRGALCVAAAAVAAAATAAARAALRALSFATADAMPGDTPISSAAAEGSCWGVFLHPPWFLWSCILSVGCAGRASLLGLIEATAAGIVGLLFGGAEASRCLQLCCGVSGSDTPAERRLECLPLPLWLLLPLLLLWRMGAGFVALIPQVTEGLL